MASTTSAPLGLCWRALRVLGRTQPYAALRPVRVSAAVLLLQSGAHLPAGIQQASLLPKVRRSSELPRRAWARSPKRLASSIRNPWPRSFRSWRTRRRTWSRSTRLDKLGKALTAVDGSILQALPKMAWASGAMSNTGPRSSTSSSKSSRGARTRGPDRRAGLRTRRPAQ